MVVAFEKYKGRPSSLLGHFHPALASPSFTSKITLQSSLHNFFFPDSSHFTAFNMQFSILTLAALASVAVAMPQEIVERGGGGKSGGSGGKGGGSGGSGGSSSGSGTAYTPCPNGLVSFTH